MNYYRYLRPILFKLDPELAHNLAIFAAKYRLLPNVDIFDDQDQVLANEIWGMNFCHPIGLAAGFDKNAECIDFLLKQDFSFIEVGSVTPKPQFGNPKPRMFRLEEDLAIIQSLGFNNKGLEFFYRNMQSRPSVGIVGSNIGKNKDSLSPIEDYLIGLEKLYQVSDYITVNVSSPNTPGLRNLQNKEELANLLKYILQKKIELTGITGKTVPIMLKVSPDLLDEDLESIVENMLKYNVDGLIVSNTTIKREGLNSKFQNKPGGLSGVPLYYQSTEILKKFYRLSKGKIPIIASGGVFSGKDAYKKITCGASLVQIYTVLIYQGLQAIQNIKRELIGILKEEGLTLKEAIGIAVK